MDPTTLVTFLFKAPPECRTVELLGSWDNFRNAYKMHHDRRRGHGFWSGCFHFKDIVFDGDKADWSKPRSGGLKQGGTYWYFYRLNDAIEAYDDSIDYTRGCPLLPGQTVNVVDVPTELEDPPSRRRSATIDVVGTLANLQRTHTLDPGDKWAVLEPPPVSKVHERCISDLALNGRLETRPVSFRNTHALPLASSISERSQRRGLSIPRQRSAGDTHSFQSRGTWSSAPPSQGNPSVFDAYSVTRRDGQASSLPTFPVPDARKPNERPSTRSGGRSHRGFDTAFDTASTRYSASRTGDEDFDGSSFVFEPADSPPLSAYGSVDWRFTGTPAHATAQSDRPESPERGDHARNERRQSRDPNSNPQNNGHDDDDSPAFDISSPTFSAATISSSGGGLNTPFRLSAGYSAASACHPPDANETSTSIEHVTERLRQLGSEDSAGSLPSEASVEERPPPFVGHYALPFHHGMGMESATTLSKASSGRASLAHHQQQQQDMPPLPNTTAGFMQSAGEEASFADAIFHELGYLGASIA